ncbi:nucleotidyltransferase domain-containing protein [Hydrogenobaculum acidophilum]
MNIFNETSSKNTFRKSVMDDIGCLLDKIREAYKEKLLGVVLFGSVVNDYFSKNSDIDILVILESSHLSFRKRIHEFYDLVGDEFKGHMLSPVVLTLQEANTFHPFYLGIFDSYITLYDKTGVVKAMKNSIENKIKSGEILELYNGIKYWRILDAKG